MHKGHHMKILEHHSLVENKMEHHNLEQEPHMMEHYSLEPEQEHWRLAPADELSSDTAAAAPALLWLVKRAPSSMQSASQ